jgi:endonuclease-3
MNKRAVTRIKWIIETMMDVSKEKKAPVFKIEKVTGNDPFKSLVFTILSSRTKDDKTIEACGGLFRIADTPESLSKLQIKKIESRINSVGFYHIKAKNLKAMAKMLNEKFNGIVPQTREELVSLPGVGRKTANVVLVYVFGKDEIPVDTHVHRISNRIGIVKTKTPEQTEVGLQKNIPKKYWRKLNHAFVAYGQTLCIPRNPKCSECKLNKICLRIGIS